jgi:pimeloyl-ACP methyl ester carboxylesterase
MMVKKILTMIAISVLITFEVLVLLVVTYRIKKLPPIDSLDFDTALGQDLSDLPETQPVTMRDGNTIAVRRYGAGGVDKPLLIMVHGSGWHGMQFHGLAKELSTQADVVVQDLRRHDVSPHRRGDIDYINQFEDDLADLIKATAQPNQKVVVLGHSSSGGLVVRFAGGEHGEIIDHAVLLAPFLKHNAPTTRKNSVRWAHVHMRRLIGLSILNTFRITVRNHLGVIQFSMPKQVLDGSLGDTATTRYSYSLNADFALRCDYLRDIAALPAFAVITGSADESFVAAQY